MSATKCYKKNAACSGTACSEFLCSRFSPDGQVLGEEAADQGRGFERKTTFTYDPMNRLQTITYPGQTVSIQFHYDYRGRRDYVIDQNGFKTSYGYDDADRLIAVTDAQAPTPGVTTYQYDTENNLTDIYDAKQNHTQFTYINGNQLFHAVYPSGYQETYLFDNNGNPQNKTDRNGQLISFHFDYQNRLITKIYPTGPNLTYTYDAAGRLTQAQDASGTYGFIYDNMDRLTEADTTYAFLSGMRAVKYGYDYASNRNSMIDPQTVQTTYGYDLLNRLNALTYNGQTPNYTFGYDALSRRTSLTRPNAITTSYGYTPQSWLNSVLHKNSGGTVLDGATYTLDNVGNRKTRTDKRTNVTLTYGPDNIYQLLSAKQGTTTKESYTYDLVGNRLTSLGVSQYNYNSSNELTSTPSGSYTYDNNGNRKSDPSGAAYTWDYENRLTQEVLAGTGGTATFKYDPFGRRAQKVFIKNSVTTTTNYFYDGDNLLEQVDNSGNVLARYSGGPWIDETLSQLQSAASSYYEQDGLGSVTSLSNAAGALANTYTYDSYGKLTASSGSLTNPFQFTGREFDAETGLRYYRFRYFDPTIGRFISEDPIGFDGGINFYRYVQNNPSLLIDPFGLSSMTFNRANGSLTLYDKNGNVVAVCTAANNTTRSSNGPWPNGTYPFSSHNNHPPDPNGPYGSYGIDVFDVPGRTGMGVHSGRANSGGPSHPTLGCVRTTDDCMKQITDWQTHDPMTDITIQ